MAYQVSSHIKRAASTPEYSKILMLRTIGNFLVLTSLFMIAKTFYQPVVEEIHYAFDQYIHKQYVVADIHNPERTELIKKDMGSTAPKGKLIQVLHIDPVEVITPPDPNFSIIIPKIGAQSKIIPNVNAADEKSYLAALKQGVAHTLGTAFPGEGGHIYLFAHSTDYVWNVNSYNAVFYLLYKLEQGDEVDLFYKGQRYVYKVTGKETVDPSQVQYLTRKTNREFLTMQTCWPPGTTLQRILVFATRVAE
ncbi:sortase [Candidatus Roizmanbacteria bacterium]|nr:sortase [Candidatus Roizmanbacteria bacterium]